MSVEENVPLGTFQSNCKLTSYDIIFPETAGLCGIKFLFPLLPHGENPPPAFNTIIIT